MANCECIAGLYDFTLEHLDCRTLLYDDFSEWKLEGNYVTPDSYIVQVTIPGSSSSVDVTVFTDRKTKITAETLGLSGTCVPDGIYCFSVVSCDKKYTVTKANTCSLECGLQQAIKKAQSERDWATIEELKRYISSVKIYAKRKMEQSADDAYKKAKRILNNINCNCSC